MRVFQRILEILPSLDFATLVFNDTPSNDFSSLSNTIDGDSYLLAHFGRIKLFPMMVPSSFYQQIVPDGFVDAGFCFTALHWVQQMPLDVEYSSSGEEDEEESVHEPVDMPARAHEDLVNFFTARHREIRRGGLLTLAIPCQGAVDSESAITCMERCMNEVGRRYDQEGQRESTYARMPVYFRSMDEIDQGMREADGEWETVRSSVVPIEHPAWFPTQADDEDQSVKETTATKNYATALTDLMMAAGSGFVVDQIRTTARENYPGDDRLIEEGMREADGEWETVRSSVVPIEHPAWFPTQADDEDQSVKETTATKNYATALTDLMMAAGSGFVVDQIRTTARENYPGDDRLIEEVREKFYEYFLQDHTRDKNSPRRFRSIECADLKTVNVCLMTLSCSRTLLETTTESRVILRHFLACAMSYSTSLLTSRAEHTLLMAQRILYHRGRLRCSRGSIASGHSQVVSLLRSAIRQPFRPTVFENCLQGE
nr:methyltransferase fus9 [Quercus suber]